jgi:lipopolysaccharide export system protein LptA
MRNSEAQKYARWSAWVAFLLLAVVVGIYLKNSWRARQVAKNAPPAIPTTVQQQSADFSYSKVEGHQTVFTVRASRATAYKEGSRNLLEDVSISVYGRQGERNDSLITKACDFNSDSGGIDCGGEVQMVLGPAGAKPTDRSIIRATTSKVTFNRDSGVAVTAAPITFEWPSGDGRAVGASYNASSGTLKLANDVELNLISPTRANSGSANSVVAPAQISSPAAESADAPAAKDLHLEGSAMVFDRNRHSVNISGMVHANQESHEISAENILLELDDALHARHLLATGRPQIRDSEPSGMMTLDADRISANLNPEGRVESVLADGMAHGNRKTPGVTDQIDAGRIQVDLLPTRSAPRLLTASGGVLITSHAAGASDATRRVETNALELNFADEPQLKGTRLESLHTLAPAKLEMESNVLSAGSSNRSTARQTLRMSGRQTDLMFDSDNHLRQLTGSGGVEVSRQIGSGAEQKTTSRDAKVNFNAGEWITVDQTGEVHFVQGLRTAEGMSAHMDRASNAITLTGPAVLSDATTHTTAKTVVFSQGSNELRADGNVLTTDTGAGTSSLTNLSSSPGHISAEHLVADPERGHALYSGNARLWQGDSVIEADTVELDNHSHTLVGRGHVRSVFPQAPWSAQGSSSTGRSTHAGGESSHASGGMLTYWGLESRARLEQNAKVESAEGSIASNLVDLYFAPSATGSASQQLQRAVATGDVTVEQEGRKGTALRGDYTPAEGKFVLSGGQPTIYDITGDTTTGRELTFHFADDTIIVDSEAGSRTVTLHRIQK